MLDEALIFLRKQLDTHIRSTFSEVNPTVQLSPLFSPDGTSLLGAQRLGMTLVNVEEERVNMAQRRAVVRSEGGDNVNFMAPEVRLNLHVLIVANTDASGKNYEEGLKSLSAAISFFQSHRYFTSTEYPALPESLDKLVVELETLDYEFQNHIWGTLGGKLLPSVLYRIRLVTIQQGLIQESGKPVIEKEYVGMG